MAKKLTSITGKEFVKRILARERNLRYLKVEELDLSPYIEDLTAYLLYESEWASMLPNEVAKKLGGYSIDISGSKFVGMKSKELKVSHIKAVGTTFRGVDFRESYFWRGNFEGSHFERVNFEDAYLQDTNFRKTRHKEVNFENASTSRIDFEGADICGARNLTLYLEDFLRDSRYLRTKITEEQFEDLKKSEENRLMERLGEQYRILTK